MSLIELNIGSNYEMIYILSLLLVAVCVCSVFLYLILESIHVVLSVLSGKTDGNKYSTKSIKKRIFEH